MMKFRQDEFQRTITTIREKNNLGMREAARDIGGLSASTLSRIENGKQPSMGDLLAICDWLGLHPGTFFQHNEDEFNEVTEPPAEYAIALLQLDNRLSEEFVRGIENLIFSQLNQRNP